MATKGPEYCHIEHNPIKIFCNGTQLGESPNFDYPHEVIKKHRTDFYDRRLKEDLGIDDLKKFANEIINVEHGSKGVYLKVQDLHFKDEVKEAFEPKEDAIIPDMEITFEGPYANFGQSLHVADVNQGNFKLNTIKVAVFLTLCSFRRTKRVPKGPKVFLKDQKYPKGLKIS